MWLIHSTLILALCTFNQCSLLEIFFHFFHLLLDIPFILSVHCVLLLSPSIRIDLVLFRLFCCCCCCWLVLAMCMQRTHFSVIRFGPPSKVKCFRRFFPFCFYQFGISCAFSMRMLCAHSLWILLWPGRSSCFFIRCCIGSSHFL